MSKLPFNVSKQKNLHHEELEVYREPEESEFICKVMIKLLIEFISQLLKVQANYLFTAITEDGENIYVSIPNKFRNSYYFARGNYVICIPLDNPKVKGEIRNVILRKSIVELNSKNLWPQVFEDGIPDRPVVKSGDYVSEDLLPPMGSSEDEEE